MRVLLTTTGSDGDVQPFLALGKRLQATGHDVRLAASDRYAARASAVGLPFTAIGPPSNEAEMASRFARVLAETNPLRQLAIVVECLEEEQRALVPALKELAEEAEVVVYPPLLVAAVAAARAVGRPHVSVHFAPLHRARRHGPTGTNLGAPLNALAWSIAAMALRRATDARLNTIFAAAGLPPARDVLLDASHSRLLDLVAVSPAVIPRDRMYRAECQITGYWFLDDADFVPPPDLAAFVATAPPVVIGFGSMTGFDARATTACVIEAAAGLEHPVVLQAGWAGLGNGSLPPNVFRAGFVPHDWLFSRAAAVVHHGGAGTTAAALRAGVPQAVVWHLGDQLAWGKLVHRLGVGIAPGSHRDLDANRLRARIGKLVSNPQINARAQALSATIRKEDGTAAAVEAIENAMADPASRSSRRSYAPQ